MQERGPDVHAALRHRVGEHCGDDVDDKRDSRHDDYRPTLDRLRLDEAHYSFVQQIQAYNGKRRVVDEGGYDLGSYVAEGHRGICRASCDPACAVCDDERGRIAKVV